MKIENTKFESVKIITPDIHTDIRGSFSETFRADIFYNATGTKVEFIQDNESVSIKHSLRGLHTQRIKPQGKLVRVVQGNVFDVVVDIRNNSSTFGEWMGIELSHTNRKQLWVPPGFAHGFVVLSDVAVCKYKTTEYYLPNEQVTIRWDDPDINIKWPVSTPILSDKDLIHAITLQSYASTQRD